MKCQECPHFEPFRKTVKNYVGLCLYKKPDGIITVSKECADDKNWCWHDKLYPKKENNETEKETQTEN